MPNEDQLDSVKQLIGVAEWACDHGANKNAVCEIIRLARRRFRLLDYTKGTELEYSDGDDVSAAMLHEHCGEFTFFTEHGSRWVECAACGAQWAVVQTNRGDDFEQVTDGDGWCADERAGLHYEEEQDG